jgi:hypothetical protein
MQDQLKNLSAQQLARLVQLAEGTGGDPTPDGAVLHAEKNAPWVNGMYSAYRAPAYVFQPYPKYLFNAGWLRANEQYLNALTLRGRRGADDSERERIIKDAEVAREACMRRVEGPEEERLLGAGWCETPQQAVERQEQFDRAVAEAAATSNWDDRNLSALAKREREAADAASDGHLTEVPRTPVKRSHSKQRGRGRPRKVGVPVVEPVEVTP